MTASDATGTAAEAAAVRPVPDPPSFGSMDAPVRPMPRLGRGIVWSDVVAEIERDNQARARDAA